MFLNEPSFGASEPEWAIDESLIWLCLKQVEAWLKRRTLFPSSLFQVRHKGIHDKLVTELGLRLAFKKKNIYFFHKFYGIFFCIFCIADIYDRMGLQKVENWKNHLFPRTSFFPLSYSLSTIITESTKYQILLPCTCWQPTVPNTCIISILLFGFDLSLH